MSIKKNDIEHLVIHNKKSSLKNHRNDSFFYNTAKYSGEIRANEILIWRSSFYLRGAYPIFHLTFDKKNELKGIELKRNPFHTFLNKLSIIFLIIFSIVLLIIDDFKPGIIGVLGVLFIAFLLNLILNQVRKFEIKIMTNELKQKIQKIENSYTQT